ncbi:MAG: DUF58 domain-containing protein [Spirochaetales bacterium]|nr:DUF58 domain-containing protein [Spirochaetales bacterium]
MKKDKFFEKVKRLEIFASKLAVEMMAGNFKSAFKGQGIEFDEVREYTPGDDTRLIDWNVTSRMGIPFTKTFREEREMTLFFGVDVSASLFAAGSQDISKIRQVQLIFAILSISAVLQHDKVGALFFSDQLEKWVQPSQGRKHILRLIHDLLKIKPEGIGSELGRALRTMDESMKRRGVCIIISDFKTSQYEKELSLLARKHDVIAIKIFDSNDVVFPPMGFLEMRDVESDDIILTFGRSKAFREEFKAFEEHEHMYWKRLCRSLNVDTLEIETSDDPALKMFQFFQKRKRRWR